MSKADANGAAAEASITLATPSKLNIFQRIVNIVLKAVSYSITVAINSGGQKKVPGGPYTFDGAISQYIAIQVDSLSYAERMTYWDNKTGLVLPANHLDKRIVGRYHNAILEMETGSSVPQEDVFTQDQLDYLLSEDFQNAFYEPERYYQGLTNNCPYSFYTSSFVTKEEGIFKAFLEAISNDAYQMQNLNQVILSYISMVDKDKLSSESKTLLQYCFVVSSYSYAYWKDKIKD